MNPTFYGTRRNCRNTAGNVVGHFVLLLPTVIEHRVGNRFVELISGACALRIERERPPRVIGCRRVKNVAPVANRNLRFAVRRVEIVVALFQHFPEREVRVVAVLRHVQRRHAERKRLQLERFLSAEERLAGQRVDFLNLLVGHGVAAAR